MQVLIYAATSSPRLEYTCRFVFNDVMTMGCTITTNKADLQQYDGPMINYSNEGQQENSLTIGIAGLLQETHIAPQKVTCFEVDGYKAIFQTPGADMPFDIFSAIFYLISRYEEYLPHTKDSYGRYAHENALAFKEGFLHLPLVNHWISLLGEGLLKKFPQYAPQLQPALQGHFNFVPTYDIDMAWSYLHKGWARNLGGLVKQPSVERLKVLMRLNPDPFDAYDWMDQLHETHQLNPLYFFLVAEKNSRYDKNILPHKKAMQQLIVQQGAIYTVGLHPSWQSGDDAGCLAKEKQLLADCLHQPVTKSRQHYIRFDLPATFQRLIDNGITGDYSMGYGSINGFRASVASSFYWFNLQGNKATSLRIHPFCFMDANAYYEQKLSPVEAFKEMMHYFVACKNVNGLMITIWHNNFLGTDPQFAGWKAQYKKFIEAVIAGSKKEGSQGT